jgi:hypothetical protein
MTTASVDHTHAVCRTWNAEKNRRKPADCGFAALVLNSVDMMAVRSLIAFNRTIELPAYRRLMRLPESDSHAPVFSLRRGYFRFKSQTSNERTSRSAIPWIGAHFNVRCRTKKRPFVEIDCAKTTEWNMRLLNSPYQ